MASVEELRAQLAVAELEADFARRKDDGEDLREAKDELRYARWVARGGPAEELAAREAYEARFADNPDLDVDPLRGVTNRAVRDLLDRWEAGQ